MIRKLLPILLSFFLCPVMQGCFFDGLCGNVPISDAISPNGKYKAVLFQRDCGATTDYSMQISIIKKDQALPNSGANTFATGSTMVLRYFWFDNDHLMIVPDKAEKIYSAKEETLLYRPQRRRGSLEKFFPSRGWTWGAVWHVSDTIFQACPAAISLLKFALTKHSHPPKITESTPFHDKDPGFIALH